MLYFFFFKQKTAYEMRISDWSSDVCSSDLIQNFTENRGKLFQAKGDVDYDLDGFLSNIAAGVRYAHRSAEEQAVNLNKATPGGNIGTGSEATAVLVSDTGLPDDFLVLGSRAPDLNNGSRFYIPNPDFLLSEDGLDAARAYFGLPAGRPDYDPGRAFAAKEDTLAAYVQGKYEADLSNSITLDGVVGVRYIRTSRTIGTFVEREDGKFDRLAADSVDHDWLPNATARFRIGDDIQIDRKSPRPNSSQ